MTLSTSGTTGKRGDEHMPVAVIIRMAVIFVVSFLGYKFLDILFDFAKSYFKGQPQAKDGENKKVEPIETKFVDENKNKNNSDNNNKDI